MAKKPTNPTKQKTNQTCEGDTIAPQAVYSITQTAYLLLQCKLLLLYQSLLNRGKNRFIPLLFAASMHYKRAERAQESVLPMEIAIWAILSSQY